eukprot:5354711-Pyramimonas_sp.AAC.1
MGIQGCRTLPSVPGLFLPRDACQQLCLGMNSGGARILLNAAGDPRAGSEAKRSEGRCGESAGLRVTA